MTTARTADPLGEMGHFLEKIAADRDKSAAANTEAGGYSGSSTHPSANADDNTAGATSGSQASKLEKEVKEDQPVGPDTVSDSGASTSQESMQLNIGTNQASTGKDPSVEDDYTGETHDPGTSHPATVADGNKYGSDFHSRLEKAASLGNSILAALGSEAPQQPKQAGAGNNQSHAPADQAEIGEKLAELLVSGGEDKQALDVELQLHVAQTIKSAREMGANIAAYLRETAKAAASEENEEEETPSNPPNAAGDKSDTDSSGGSESESEESEGGDSESSSKSESEEDTGGISELGDMGAGGGDPGSTDPMSGGPESDPAAPPMDMAAAPSPEEEAVLAQALAGGDAMGAEGVAGDMLAPGGGMPGAGMPPEAGMPPAGGDPLMGTLDEGQEIDPRQVEMILSLLQEMGQTPQSLEVAAAEKLAQHALDSLKSASDKAKGPVKFIPKNATEERAMRETRGFFEELFNRSR